MTGPEGQKLKINILSGTEISQLPRENRPPINRISVYNELPRENAYSYALDTGCATITHEVLHLLGLVDEYDGTSDNWGCRTPAIESSIMGNSHERYPETFTQNKSCSCGEVGNCARIFNSNDQELKDFYRRSGYGIDVPPEIETECMSEDMLVLTLTYEELRAKMKDLPYLGQDGRAAHFLDSFSLREDNKYRIYGHKCTCPEGTDCAQVTARYRSLMKNSYDAVPTDSCPRNTRLSETLSVEPRGQEFAFDGSTINYTTPPKFTTLLNPIHFERIIAGNCPTATPRYNECSKWAYRGKTDKNNCEGKPESCNSQSYYFGADQ
jgi:hypothetical protein